MSIETILDGFLEVFDKLDEVKIIVGFETAYDVVAAAADLTPAEAALAFEPRALLLLLLVTGKAWMTVLLCAAGSLCSVVSIEVGAVEEELPLATSGRATDAVAAVVAVLIVVVVALVELVQESRPSSRIISTSSFSVSFDSTVIRV